MPIKIEKGIRIYPANGRSNDIAIALVEMQKGDSFLLPEKSRSSVHVYAKRVKVKIAVRKGLKDRNEEGLIRIWKLEP